ncbi:hypothetical protein TVAG_478610 [Trichomonas vaginalis G3]|uniref:ABC-2 type transporter transmembrane domain-containing protein n=1 Tax=Trichomonas vaginalis (strain ATCC PRA-98 / G3) TaxID=412133 RepID=A2DZX7_TRIV3|nr:ABC-2 family transporter protein family [Trichomonas vaginalis G3]EAY14036.1 hypothetical protein TVAG_478610 [Trichomonas vaginalis G3]KAI5519526.1 ABC-2 family transporter protein family [Trichomonas vaginalis G3]|eukprot:XP_001326259.1 hypothetical protein [Trichomonas vaginalis G3]
MISGPAFCLAMAMIYAFIIGQITEELKSSQRNYMFMCGLSPITYWLANYIVDVIISEAFSLLYFIIYYIGGVQNIIDYPGYSYFTFFISALS